MIDDRSGPGGRLERRAKAWESLSGGLSEQAVSQIRSRNEFFHFLNEGHSFLIARPQSLIGMISRSIGVAAMTHRISPPRCQVLDGGPQTHQRSRPHSTLIAVHPVPPKPFFIPDKMRQRHIHNRFAPRPYRRKIPLELLHTRTRGKIPGIQTILRTNHMEASNCRRPDDHSSITQFVFPSPLDPKDFV